jgi:tetratricopeptide (TPR) repeat protein
MKETGESVELFGRDEELKALRAMVDGAASKGNPCAIITGEAGAGKTTIAEDALMRAGELGLETVRAKCQLTSGGRPYQPFIDMMEDLRSREKEKGSGDETPMMLVGLDRDGETDAPGKQDRERMFGEVSEFFHSRAKRNGIALLLDDLQFAEASTLSLFLYLLRSFSDGRSILLGTCRFEGRDPHTGNKTVSELIGRILSDRQVRSLPIKNLGREDAARMMNARARRPLPESLRNWIYDKTGGNPYYIETVIAYLKAEALLGRTHDLAKLKLPSTVHATVLERFKRLSDLERRVIEYMAVMPSNPTLALLDKCLNIGETILVDTLDTLLRFGIIREDPDNEVYSFTQDIIPEAISTSMGDLKKRHCHRRIAESLEEMYAGKEEAVIFNLAYHYGSLGPSEKTLRYSEMAGDQSFRDFAFVEATEHYRRALQSMDKLGGAKPEHESELIVKLADAEKESGEWDEALKHFSEAVARSPGDAAFLDRAYAGMGIISIERSQWKLAEETLEKAIQLAQSHGHYKSLADLYNIRASLSFRLGKMDELVKYTGLAKATAEQAQVLKPIARAEMLLANAYCTMSEEFEKAESYYLSALAAATECNDLELMAKCEGNYGYSVSRRGEYGKALECFRKALEYTEKMGNINLTGILLSNIGRCNLFTEKYDDAQRYFESALEIFRRLGQRQLETFVLYHIGILRTRTGDLPAAEKYFGDSIRIYEELNIAVEFAECLLCYSDLWSEKGDREKALQALNKARSLFEESGLKNRVAETDKRLASL